MAYFPQIRSISLDMWMDGQVSFLSRTGNTIANAIFEDKLAVSGASRPVRDDTLGLERFIRRKYIDHEWATMEDGKVAWPPPPPPPLGQSPSSITLSDYHQPVSTETSVAGVAIQPCGVESQPYIADLLFLGETPYRTPQQNIMDDDCYWQPRYEKNLRLIVYLK